MQLSDRLEVKRLLDREVERVNSIEPRVQAVVRGDWVVVLADGRLVREWRWWVSTDVPVILEHAGNWTSRRSDSCITPPPSRGRALPL